MTPDVDLSERLVRVGTAALADGGARVLDRRLAPVWAGAVVAGPALTVRCAEGDNLAVQVAVADAAPGSVLVIAAGGPDAPCAVWGEVLAVAATHRGVAGVVLDGCTRDCDAITAARFPIWCAGASPSGPTKAGGGSVGDVVLVGGDEVRHGEWIVADGDGVVVLSAELVLGALVAAEAKAAREREWFAALADGATTLELFGLDPSSVSRSQRE